MAPAAPAASERTPLLSSQSASTEAQSSPDSGNASPSSAEPADADAEHEAFERAKEALPLSILVPSILSLFTVLFLAALDGESRTRPAVLFVLIASLQAP